MMLIVTPLINIDREEGARHFEGTFSFKKGAFSKNEKGTQLFIAKSWGCLPPVPPALGSYVYKHRYSGHIHFAQLPERQNRKFVFFFYHS